MTLTRREVVKAAALATAALPLGSTSARAQAPAAGPVPADRWRGLKAGVASYTLRKLPLDGAIRAIQRVGLRYVSIKDFHLPLTSTTEERRAVASSTRRTRTIPCPVWPRPSATRRGCWPGCPED